MAYVKIGGPTGDPLCVAAALLVDTGGPLYGERDKGWPCRVKVVEILLYLC